MRKAVINPENCKECGVCMTNCSKQALADAASGLYSLKPREN